MGKSKKLGFCGQYGEILELYARGYSANKISQKMGLERQYVLSKIHKLFADMSVEQREELNEAHRVNGEFAKRVSIRNLSPDDTELLFDVIAPRVIDVIMYRCDGVSPSDTHMDVRSIADTVWDVVMGCGEYATNVPAWLNLKSVREMTRGVLVNVGFSVPWSASNSNVLVWGGSTHSAIREEFPQLNKLVCEMN